MRNFDLRKNVKKFFLKYKDFNNLKKPFYHQNLILYSFGSSSFIVILITTQGIHLKLIL